jgi:hypothetical protein
VPTPNEVRVCLHFRTWYTATRTCPWILNDPLLPPEKASSLRKLSQIKQAHKLTSPCLPRSFMTQRRVTTMANFNTPDQQESIQPTMEL